MDETEFKGEMQPRSRWDSQGWIEIIDTPPGEAPLVVRQAWVGLVLPTLDDRPRRVLSAGVLHGPRGGLQKLWWLLSGRFKKEEGWRVPSAEAVRLLAEKSAESALWWRENAPRFLEPSGCFLFHAQACRKVEGGEGAPSAG